MSTIDYKAKAEALLTDANQYSPGSVLRDAFVAEAQVSATLALVEATERHAENRRIGNLIAFMDAEGGPYKHINNIWNGQASALDEIREGLGL